MRSGRVVCGSRNAAGIVVCLLAMSVGIGPVLAADSGLTQLQIKRFQIMLRDTRAAIEKDYFDPGFAGVDLAAQAKLASERIDKATSVGQAMSAIAQFTFELDDSHTFFLPPAQTVSVDYGWRMRIYGERCLVEHVKAGSDAEHQQVHRGDEVLAVNGWKLARANLWKIKFLLNVLVPQPGLHVELRTPAGEMRELNLAAKPTVRKRILDLTGGDGGGDIAWLIQQAERDADDFEIRTADLSPGIGYLRLPGFSWSPEDVQRAVRRLIDHRSLIVDLRGNPGGAEKTLLAMLGEFTRADLEIGQRSKRGEITKLMVKGRREHAFAGRLFVLIDSDSASASEMFARAVQLASLGTVIGDRSAGAVMTSQQHGMLVNAGDNVVAYGASVTMGDVRMADGKRIEKLGVTPDFVVLPTGEDLATGRDPALEQALKFASAPD